MVDVKNSFNDTESKNGIDSETKIYTIPKVTRIAMSPENINAHSINLSTKLRLIFFFSALLIVGFALDIIL